MEEKYEKLRDGIYALRTRRTGKVAEIMIKKMLGLEKPDSIFYDLLDTENNKKVEVKFSIAMRANAKKITEENVIEEIMKALKEKRFLKYEEAFNCAFDCNIQQIKTKEFDILYYGIFFSDKIIIFKMTKKEFEENKSKIGYSDKQHKGNKGEGQFHIKKKSLKFHVDNYFLKELSYEDFYNILDINYIKEDNI